jgi:hypothetical protein
MLQAAWSVLDFPQRCGVPRYRSAMEVTDRSGTHLLGIKAAGTRFIYLCIYLFLFVFFLTKCRIIGLLVRIELEMM